MVQEPLVERVARLARERFAGRAARYDADSSFPHENYQDLHDAGLLGLTVPRAYGGLEVDAPTYALCLCEMAKGDSATALTFNMHATVASILAALASPEQQRRYFSGVIERGKLLASISSEPSGASFRGVYRLETVFEPVEGGYRVSGVKHFCSLADAADWYLTMGMVAGSSSAREGILTAVIRRDAPGVSVEGVWDAVGMRGTTSHSVRFDTLVPHEDVIGQPGQYLTVDISGFALGYAATYLGIGEAAFEYIVDYARTRTFKPSPDPLSHHPLTQREIGDMATSLRAARLLMLEAARLKDAGDRRATMLAINQAKYFSAEVGQQVTQRALRLAGGRGILKEMPLERWHRDSLAGPVMPPSNDRCLETIGKLVCGLEAATLEFQ